MIPYSKIASLRFLQSKANSSHIWFTSCHVGESTGCQSLPLFYLPCACHFRSFAILGDCNILLNLGMGGKYHNTFVGILLVFLAPTLFTFHLDVPQVGHEDVCNHLGMHVSFCIPSLMHSMFSLPHTWIRASYCSLGAYP